MCDIYFTNPLYPYYVCLSPDGHAHSPGGIFILHDTLDVVAHRAAYCCVIFFIPRATRVSEAVVQFGDPRYMCGTNTLTK